MTILSDTIGKWKLGEAVTFRNLCMFPLVGKPDDEPDYLTLNEATTAGFVRISEVSEGGSVPELRLENTGTRPVLLLDGEQLVGAKQNRVLNLTILAPAGKTIDIPVSCVEQGRWSYDSPVFSTSERTHFAQGRARKAASVSASMAQGRGRYSDQGEVWEEIAMKSERMASPSPTAAMDSVYEQHETSIGGFLDSFMVQDGQAGAVFAINNRVVGLDIFGHPATFGKLFRKLVSGYAVDALEVPVAERKAGVDQVRVFLDSIAGCTHMSTYGLR